MPGGQHSGRRSSDGRSATRLQTQLISLPALAAHIVPLRGHCGGAGYPVPACVPAAAARVLGLAPGDQVTLRDSSTHATVRVRITGTFRRAGPAEPYWMLDPMGAGAVQRTHGFTTAGPLVTSPAAIARAHLPITSASVIGLPDFRRLTGTGLAALGSHLATRVSDLNSSTSFHDATVTTSLPAQLSALATALVVARTKILAGILTLLVIAGATLGIAARLLAQRRATETALLGARGASRTQIARRCLVDAAVVAGPAAIGGPLLGTLLAPLLAGHLTAGLTGAVWLAAAAVAAGCVAVIGLPWLRRPPSPIRQRASRGRQRSIAAAVYARADLAVIVLAAGALWQLIRSAGPVSTGLDGTLSADPILVVAPVLALVGAALLTLRALPLAARLGDRLAARGRGLVVPVAAWQISRRALRQAGPTMVAVLAVAAAVLALAQRDSWQRSVQAQASFQSGADQRITMPTSAPLALGQVAGITAAHGVAAATPAVRSTFSLPSGKLATLLALDGSAAAGIIPARAAGPAPAILRRLSDVPAVGVPVPGRPEVVRLTATLGRAAIRQPVLFVQFMDAAGIGYLLPAGTVPADGRPHVLSVTVAARSRADYPLRLTGFTLQFTMPGRRRPADTLTISAGAAAAARPGSALPRPKGTPFPLARAGQPLRFTATQGTGGTGPAAVRARVTESGAVVATFTPGVAITVFGGTQGVPSASGGISLAESYPGAGRPLPAVVTHSLLAATGLRLGAKMQVSLDGTAVEITPVAVVPHLPTVGGSPSVLIDQRGLCDALAAGGAPPLSITEWWLRTSGAPVLTGLPAGTTISSETGLASALRADPLSRDTQQALLALAIAAVLLALVGMLVSVATGADRASDLALLDALGMPPGQIARLLALEQAVTAIATSVVGLLFGVALSEVIIPADTLTAQATRPIPPVMVQVPWLAAALIAAVMAAVPTLAIMATSPRADSGAAMIRLEGQT